MAASKQQETLPRGVGRVPTWWMELTPHYVLDLDEEATRRDEEERLARYFAEMAAADDAGELDENGNPIGGGGGGGAGGDGWKSNWGGRSTGKNGEGGGGEGASSKMFGGRNFKPGSASWDPKQWGIKENDPDYKSYLTGAKLPAEYIQAMREFGATKTGITHPEWVTNAHISSGSVGGLGKYGRLAETPKHQPAWAKKKLRSSTAGAAIRQGKYNDSPNKHLHPVANALLLHNQAKNNATPREPPLVTAQENHRPSPPPPPRQQQEQQRPVDEPEPVVPEEQAPVPQEQNFKFNDYYHNASADQVANVQQKVRVTATQEHGKADADAAVPEQAPPRKAVVQETYVDENGHQVDYVDGGEEVEYVDEEEYEEEYVEEYEEEEPYESSPPPAAVAAAPAGGGGAGDLQDLQAILAAKQAELMRLQSLQ